MNEKSNDNIGIMVSICCATYNHSNYIASAMDSFLSQKTNFKYEILVHDDASTDDTADIVRCYEKQYPDIVKGIFQTENQYSKGIKNVPTYVFPVAKGKYLAFCEGDDFWCDNMKLQEQVDFLETHPEYVACTHSSYIVNETDGTKSVFHCVSEDCDVLLDDICKWNNKIFLTSSLMFRRQYTNIPQLFMIKQIGDFPIALWLGINGKIRYMKSQMSVYRYNVPGSWSVRMNDRENRVNALSELTDACINLLNETDEYSNHVFHKKIVGGIKMWETRLLIAKGDDEELWSKHKKEYFEMYSIRAFISLFLRTKMKYLWKWQHSLRYPCIKKSEK